MLIGGKDFTLIGRPLLPRDAFRIVATVVEKNLSQHKICYKHKKAVKTNNPKTRCKFIILLVLFGFRNFKKFIENLAMIYFHWFCCRDAWLYNHIAHQQYWALKTSWQHHWQNGLRATYEQRSHECTMNKIVNISPNSKLTSFDTLASI